MNGSKCNLVNGTPGTQLSLEQNELKSIVEQNEKIFFASKKNEALSGLSKYPPHIALCIKRFFKGSSSMYNKYTIELNSDGSYHITMEKPGNVPGSKAIYHKIINSDGRTLKVYKDTFDPKGNLIHRKDK